MKKNIIVTVVALFLIAFAGQGWSMGGNNESPEQQPMGGTEQESPGYGQEQEYGTTQEDEYQQEMGGTEGQDEQNSTQPYGMEQEGSEGQQEMGGTGESQ